MYRTIYSQTPPEIHAYDIVYETHITQVMFVKVPHLHMTDS